MINSLRRTAKLAVLNVLHLLNQSQHRRLYGDNRSLPLRFWPAVVNEFGHLAMGGCDIVALARRYGTPLHVIDGEHLIETYSRFRDAFLRCYPKVEIAYSYKTNPLPGALKVLHEAGASAEVISHFELWLALHLGMPGERIIFNGPAKTLQALDLAVSSRVKLINIDNLAEPEAIQSLAKRYSVRQRVGVRVVPSVGWAGQFGLNLRSGAAFSAFRLIQQLDHLVPCGIHVHLGTGLKSVDIYATAVKEVLEFGSMVKQELGIDLDFLDFGGGFGVSTVKPYSVTDTRLMANGFPATVVDVEAHPSLDAYARAVADLVRRYYPEGGAVQPTIILEPGRAITSSAQVLVSSILAVKARPNAREAVIIDAGKNLALPTGYERHELLAASKLRRPATEIYDVFGPLCHPGDVLFRSLTLPAVEPGDVLALMDAGAYFVPNQTNFSNPRPAVVMIRKGLPDLIRERETFEHIIARDLCSQDT
jgi:diaminopimelate decarboxylase